MSAIFRKLFPNKEDEMHIRLLRAVKRGQFRQVASLLDLGADPLWTRRGLCLLLQPSSIQQKNLNALLIACALGHVRILDLCLNVIYARGRDLLARWGYAMVCTSIRYGKWQIFVHLSQRHISAKYEKIYDASSGMFGEEQPLAAFIAAQNGRPEFLRYFLRKNSMDWPSYEFSGHTLLSIASLNGNLKCVEELLSSSNCIPMEILQAAIHCAIQNRQAHVLVLLTSRLPEHEEERATETLESFHFKEKDERISLAETEVSSNYNELASDSSWLECDEFDYDEERQSAEGPKSVLRKSRHSRNSNKNQRVRFQCDADENELTAEFPGTSGTDQEISCSLDSAPMTTDSIHIQPMSQKKRRYVRDCQGPLSSSRTRYTATGKLTRTIQNE